MKVEFFDSTKKDLNINFNDYIDYRFLKCKPSETQRRISRCKGKKELSAILVNNDEILGYFIGDSNTWAGLKTIFCNGLLIKKKLDDKQKQEVVKKLIDAVVKKIKTCEFKAFLIEMDEDNEALNKLIKLQLVHTRCLINYVIGKNLLIKNTENSIKKVEDKGFKLVNGDVNNLSPYLSFMDSRPGWLTSNASMSKQNGDSLVTIKTAFDTTSAICVYNKDSGIISRLATMPLSRGSGFASALLEYVAKEINTEKIRMVDINKKNEEAHEFLIHKGFTSGDIKSELSYAL